MKHFRGYLGNSYLISDFDYDENVFEIKIAMSCSM